jgi:succinate-acetate transporter protein
MDDGFELNKPHKGPVEESLFMRLIWMIVIALMMSFSQTILGVLTVVQFVIMLINKREPNERIVDFGTDLGIWMAKAVRYQTAASEVKPWPWTELD